MRTAQAVSEWPDDPQAQADADRAAERLAQAAEQHTALLEKVGEVLAADEWDRAFSVEALAGGDGRPIASCIYFKSPDRGTRQSNATERFRLPFQPRGWLVTQRVIASRCC